MGSFGSISTVIQKARGKTVAVNLAQEKIESFKNISYHRLLVTQSTATSLESGVGGFRYDDQFYPSESIMVEKREYIRRHYCPTFESEKS